MLVEHREPPAHRRLAPEAPRERGAPPGARLAGEGTLGVDLIRTCGKHVEPQTSGTECGFHARLRRPP